MCAWVHGCMRMNSTAGPCELHVSRTASQGSFMQGRSVSVPGVCHEQCATDSLLCQVRLLLLFAALCLSGPLRLRLA